MDKRELTGIGDLLVTEWLRPGGACGPTGYGVSCRSNTQWCMREIERLATKGVRACLVSRNDRLYANGMEIAVAILPEGVTAEELQAEFDKIHGETEGATQGGRV